MSSVSEVAGYWLVNIWHEECSILHYASGTRLDIYPIVTWCLFHDRNTAGAWSCQISSA
jgi:hypothetical protein